MRKGKSYRFHKTPEVANFLSHGSESVLYRLSNHTFASQRGENILLSL